MNLRQNCCRSRRGPRWAWNTKQIDEAILAKRGAADADRTRPRQGTAAPKRPGAIRALAVDDHQQSFVDQDLKAVALASQAVTPAKE